MPEDGALRRLIEDGLARPGPPRARTTARWQAAMARAALELQRSGAPWQDLRLPIAAALLAHYGQLPDEEIARLVEAMLPIERAELEPVRGAPAAAQP